MIQQYSVLPPRTDTGPEMYMMYECLQLWGWRVIVFLVGIISTQQKNFPFFWVVCESIFFLWFFYISPISLTPPFSALTIPFENHRVTPLWAAILKEKTRLRRSEKQYLHRLAELGQTYRADIQNIKELQTHQRKQGQTCNCNISSHFRYRPPTNVHTNMEGCHHRQGTVHVEFKLNYSRLENKAKYSKMSSSSPRFCFISISPPNLCSPIH